MGGVKGGGGSAQPQQLQGKGAGGQPQYQPGTGLSNAYQAFQNQQNMGGNTMQGQPPGNFTPNAQQTGMTPPNPAQQQQMAAMMRQMQQMRGFGPGGMFGPPPGAMNPQQSGIAGLNANNPNPGGATPAMAGNQGFGGMRGGWGGGMGGWGGRFGGGFGGGFGGWGRGRGMMDNPGTDNIAPTPASAPAAPNNFAPNFLPNDMTGQMNNGGIVSLAAGGSVPISRGGVSYAPAGPAPPAPAPVVTPPTTATPARVSWTPGAAAPSGGGGGMFSNINAPAFTQPAAWTPPANIQPIWQPPAQAAATGPKVAPQTNRIWVENNNSWGPRGGQWVNGPPDPYAGMTQRR